MKIEMLFPKGKSKAFIASYDDGHIEDRKIIEIFNKYGIKGTFHINSGKLFEEDHVNENEIKKLYEGHEVSSHTVSHPHLHTKSKEVIIDEVESDRLKLESLVEYPVRGFSYPFGSYNNFVKENLNELEIEYARTINDTHDFTIPHDFLEWNPTCHHNDAIDKIEDFFNKEKLSLFYVWGHSWELGSQEHWDIFENFFKQIGNNKEVLSITNIELVDYIKAYRNLKFSVNKKIIQNLSSIDIYLKIDNETVLIKAGEYRNC